MKRSTASPFLPFAALLLTTAVATQAPTPDQSADLRAKAIDVRLAAIDAMVLSTKKDADSLLLPLLADKDWEVQERTAMALGKRKCAPALGQLVDLGIDGDIRRVRQAAAFAVGQQGQDPIGRPDVFPATFPQFLVRGFEAPRVVAILRCGAGPMRRPEYWIFEIVSEGNRLRRLYRTDLRNDHLPEGYEGFCFGRFLVTFDDRGKPRGTTDNCLVLYDLARGISKAWRLEDVLPKERLVEGSLPGDGWRRGWSQVDSTRMLLFPNDLEECTKAGYPFLAVDMAGMEVKYEKDPPRQLSEGAHVTVSSEATYWEWSMGSPNEPAWKSVSALPLYLKCTVRWSLDRLGSIGIHASPIYFKYEEKSGEFQRCEARAWTDPPERWASPEHLPVPDAAKTPGKG